jgi:hypothetical protein
LVPRQHFDQIRKRDEAKEKEETPEKEDAFSYYWSGIFSLIPPAGAF